MRTAFIAKGNHQIIVARQNVKDALAAWESFDGGDKPKMTIERFQNAILNAKKDEAIRRR